MYNLLARELFRQGLLMAERDAGLAARDRVLEGTGTDDDLEPNPWDVSVALIPHVGIDVRVIRAGPGTNVLPAWKVLIPYKNNWLDYVDLAEKSDAFVAREFREAVNSSSAAPAAPVRRAASTTPTGAKPLPADQTERLLGEVNFISQFRAVRSAHAAIRAGGETPEALGALVRGYANLGQLTLFMWSAAPKAYAARSMLYAQRMIDRWPDAPGPWWHRAYALSLAGLQGRALEDLEQGDGIAAAATHAPGVASATPTSAPAPAPAWVPLLRHYCRYETARLGEMAEKLAGERSPLTPLAQFLIFATLESSDSPSLIDSVGQAVLSENPDCFRVLDRMIEASGVSFNHPLTVYGPAALMASLAKRLAGLPDLPPGARSALGAAIRDERGASLRAWAKLATELVNADAPPGDELPWRALGQMIRETQFVQVWRRTNFIVNLLGADASDEVNQFFPLVEAHRYRGFVQLHAHNHAGSSERREALKDVRVIDPVLPMGAAFTELNRAGLRPRPDQQPAGESLSYWQWGMRFRDDTSVDAERTLRAWNVASDRDRDFLLYETRELSRASPHSPLYMAKLIQYDWESAEPQVKQWEENWGDHPILAGALGRQYVKLRKWPEAERSLSSYLSKTPDLWACRMLALAQLRQGREGDWLATLKAGLQRPDYGLDHASINSSIAWHYMQRHEFATAKPYAYAAADSYSSWGLKCAAHAEEGLGHWDLAEQFVRRDAERYDQPAHWYEWCVRTGRGDAVAAERAARQELRSPRPDKAGRETQVTRGVYELFAGRADEAERPLRDSATRYNDTWSAMQVALLRESARDRAGRDEVLRSLIDVAERNPPVPGVRRAQTEWVRPHIAELGKVYLAAGNDGALDATAAEKIVLDTHNSKEQLNLNYFVGRILQLRGDRDAAIKFLKRAAGDGRNNWSSNCVLAWIELRALGIDPAGIYTEPPDSTIEADED